MIQQKIDVTMAEDEPNLRVSIVGGESDMKGWVSLTVQDSFGNMLTVVTPAVQARRIADDLSGAALKSDAMFPRIVVPELVNGRG